MARCDWEIIFKVEKAHRLVMPSFARVLQWLAGNGAKCTSIFIRKRQKEDIDKNTKVVVGPNFLAHWYIYDFQVCEGRPELLRTMDYINRHGYDLISVTQYQETYTVFFRRRACG